MKPRLRILMLEDSPMDAELILSALADDGIDYEAVRVETRAEFLAAVESEPYDLVLSDCSLPSFDGVSALKISRSRRPEVPFIFVSGTMGEELAIETLKSGATDYVLKHRLGRLVPAVRRAIAEAADRAARQQAERSREEAESLFRALFDQVTVGVAIADLNGRIIRANPALESMMRYGLGALTSTMLSALTHPDDAAVGAEADQELRAGQRASYEIEKRFVRRDATVCWGRLVVSHIRGEDGTPRFSVNLIEDVTERKEMAQRFLQAQKIEVVGRLAAGFTHDFNNLLTLINGYSQVLLGQVSPHDPARRELQEIRSAGERANRLTQRLLTFGRQEVRRPATLHLNGIITSLDHMLRRFGGDDVRLILRLDPDAGFIEEDQTQIEQVIINLAVNARDAMPEGGELTMATERTYLDRLQADRYGVMTGEYVVLTVADTGHGMDSATRSRIFEPFFTTKEVGKGTGLGLWMVREIIQQGRGAVTVDSEQGKGTRFRIYLPRLARQAEAETEVAAPAVSASTTVRGGSETILVVEDDPMVGELAREMLEAGGYRVVLAADGAEAILKAQDPDNQAELLMTDLEMPRMGGAELATILTDLWPDVKVLYVSGHPSREGSRKNAGAPAGGYLQKPFTQEALLESIRLLLDAPEEITILVVDDDPAIRIFLRHVLESSGYVVLEASNGRQAVQRLSETKNVDVMITDLIMPDQEGLETIQSVRKEFPNLRMVAMSGGFGEQFLKAAQKLGASETLHKPFSADEVQAVVRQVLTRQETR